MFIENYQIVSIFCNISTIGVETKLYNTNENEDLQATSVIDSIAKSGHPIETMTTGNRYKELAFDEYKLNDSFITFCTSLPK